MEMGDYPVNFNLKSIALVALCGIAFSLGAYVPAKAQPAGATSKDGEAKPTSYLSEDDQKLQMKQHAFIECINEVDSSLRKRFDVYTEFFARQTASAKQRNSLSSRISESSEAMTFAGDGFLYKLGGRPGGVERSIVTCVSDLKDAVAQPPKDADLDRVGTQYSETLTTLTPLLKTAGEYYKDGDHSDDKMAKGKALDAQIKPLFVALLATSTEMRKIITSNEAMLQNHRLDGIIKVEGKGFRWYTERYMQQARETVRIVADNMSATKPSLAAVQAAETALQAVLDEGKAFAAQHPDSEQSDNQPAWFSLEDSFSDFMRSVKGARRTVADIQANGGKFTNVAGFTEPGGRELRLQAQYLIGYYNDLIETYNRR